MKFLFCNLVILMIVTLSFELISADQKDCIPKDFGYGSFVCVCNSTYCDTLPPIRNPQNGTIIKVTSSQKDKRWFMEKSNFLKMKAAQFIDECDVILTVNREKKFQKILGFGGAFTDSAGINLRSVSESLQDFALKGYFAAEGLEYNLGRVPIAGTDFSTHPYSYDDLPPGQTDPALQNFALTKEDFQYKIPFIKEAMALSSKRGVTMKLYGSPWSAPGWMKTNGKLNGNGRLKREFYSPWASYIVRFLQKYMDHGIPFFGITTGNEPSAGLFFDYPFNQLAWQPGDQAIWIEENLGPQLHGSGFENLTVFTLDDQRLFLPSWAIIVLKNKNASQYVGGIGVHWYWDFLTLPETLDLTHDYFPTLPILYTEACTGWAFWDFFKVIPGSWVRAESYAKDILQNLQHWVVGWTDWNLALDLEGGPNWVKNFVDSPVLVNQEENEVYRQPMYYALAHFSKVIPEGSERIACEAKGLKKQNIDFVAFLRPDSSTAIVMINVNHFPLTVDLQDGDGFYKMVLEPRSIVSLVWNV